MRILIATPYLPWPLNSGGNAAQFSTLQSLMEDHEFTLVAPFYRLEQASLIEELASKLPRVRVRGVFCGAPPEGRVDRTVRWAKATARRILRRPLLLGDGLPYYPFQPLPGQFIHALSEELQRGTDLVQAEFAEMLPLGVWLPPQMPRLFVHHQIHTIYAERFIKAHDPQAYSKYLTDWMSRQEQMYLQHYDATITFSDEDGRILQSWPGIKQVFTSPFPVPSDVGFATKLAPSFNGRFIFLGSEDHDANRGALRWLIKEIWPKIRAELPHAELTVIGRWSESWQSVHRTEKAQYVGFLPDLSAAIQGGIMLVPLLVGSGIRTKILAALAQGVPVITTTVGAEGLLTRAGVDLLVADETQSFASVAINLAKNQKQWAELSSSGHRTVQQHYSPEQVRRRRNEIYAALKLTRAAGQPELARS